MKNRIFAALLALVHRRAAVSAQPPTPSTAAVKTVSLRRARRSQAVAVLKAVPYGALRT